MKPYDHAQGRELVEWFIKQQKLDAYFLNYIIFSIFMALLIDKILENPQVIIVSLTCHCLVRIFVRGIIEPFFIENEAAKTKTKLMVLTIAT